MSDTEQVRCASCGAQCPSSSRACQLVEGDETVRVKDPLNGLLHSVEAHETATFTLQMVCDGGQSLEFLATALIWAVIEILLMSRGVEVLVQRLEMSEMPATKQALVGPSIGVP